MRGRRLRRGRRVKYTNWEMDARIPLLVHDPRAPHTFGVHTRSLVEHVDLYPTLAELAGVPVRPEARESIEGSSYAELFRPGAEPGTAVWVGPHNGSYTQYPRCNIKLLANLTLDMSATKRCASVPKQDFVLMGYSVRTPRWRYTEWAKWDGQALRPVWFASPPHPSALAELYDHAGGDTATGPAIWDDFENENVVAANEEVAVQLSRQLRAFYQGVRGARGRPYGV